MNSVEVFPSFPLIEMEQIYLEHNYALLPVKCTENITESTTDIVKDIHDATLSSGPTSSLPTRRLQRQFNKAEKEQCEEGEDKNEELLKEKITINKEKLLVDKTEDAKKKKTQRIKNKKQAHKIFIKKVLSLKQKQFKEDEKEECDIVVENKELQKEEEMPAEKVKILVGKTQDYNTQGENTQFFKSKKQTDKNTISEVLSSEQTQFKKVKEVIVENKLLIAHEKEEFQKELLPCETEDTQEKKAKFIKNTQQSDKKSISEVLSSNAKDIDKTDNDNNLNVEDIEKNNVRQTVECIEAVKKPLSPSKLSAAAASEGYVCLRERKSKRIELMSNKIQVEKKPATLTKEGTTSKQKLSPRKHSCPSFLSTASEKKSPKSKERNISVVDKEESSASNIRLARRQTLSSFKRKCSKKQQIAQNPIFGIKRKKSLHSFDENNEDIEEIQDTAAKDNMITENKEFVEEPDSKVHSPPSSTASKPKIPKRIKRDSLSIGFEPALFSQPDVMVKIKSDDAPSKKSDMENEEIFTNSIGSNNDPSSLAEQDLKLDSQMSETEDHLKRTDVCCAEKNSTKESDSSAKELSATSIEKSNLLDLKDPILSNDLYNQSEVELSETSNKYPLSSDIDTTMIVYHSINQNLPSVNNLSNVAQQCVVIDTSDDNAPELNISTRSVLSPSDSQVTNLSSMNDSDISLKVTIEKNILQEIDIPQETLLALMDDNHTVESYFSTPEVLKDGENTKFSAVPERKSQRIIKRKEFFEEMSFQAIKRTAKQTPESSQTKKASKETSELLQPERITKQSVEPSKAKGTFKQTAESSKAKRTHKQSAESSQAKIIPCQQTEKTKQKSSTFKIDASEVNKKQEDPNSSGSESSVLSIISHSSLDHSITSEDDSKLYCICRRPFGNRFMIGCDFCGDWMHGSCVGITEHQGRLFASKQYMCPKCTKAASEASFTDQSPINELKRLIGKRERKKLRAIKRKRRAARRKARAEKALLDPDNVLKKRARKRKRKWARKNDDRNKSKSEIQESTSDKKIKILKTACSEINEELSEESETMQKCGEFSTETADLQTNIVSKGKQKSKDEKNKSTPKNVKHDKGETPMATTSSTHLKTAISPKITVITHPSIKKNISSKESPKKINDQHPTLKAKVLNIVKEKISKDNKKKNNCVSCEKISSEGSCYCTYVCLEKHVNESLKLLKESKTSSKTVEAFSEKLVLFDRFKGTVTRENISTTPEIIQWLKSNPNFMIACTSDSQARSDSTDEKCDINFPERKEESDENARETVRLNVRKTLKNILEDR